MKANTFQNKAHAEEYRAWIKERIESGELAETLRRRHMIIQLEPETIKLWQRIQQEKGATANEPQDRTHKNQRRHPTRKKTRNKA
jgi:hypothetical protein